MAAPSLAELGLEEAEKLGFQSRQEFIDEAVNTYLASRRDKRLALAIALYEDEKVSLGRAVEIAGVGIETFKRELGERDVPRHGGSMEEGADAATSYREPSSGS